MPSVAVPPSDSSSSSTGSRSGSLHATPHSLSIYLNRGHVAGYLEHALTRAEAMYRAGAYLHWYRRYGCQDEDLFYWMEQARTVVADYAKMTSPAPDV